MLRNPLILSLECLYPLNSMPTQYCVHLYIIGNKRIKQVAALSRKAGFSCCVWFTPWWLSRALCLHRVCSGPVRGGLPAAVWMWERRPVWQTDWTVQLRCRLDWRALWERWASEPHNCSKANEPAETVTSWELLQAGNYCTGSIVLFLLIVTSNLHLLCSACEPGLFGAGCEERCQCVHGASCHHVSGECQCPPGWRAKLCDKGTDCS